LLLTADEQEMTFQPGESGNPKGRPVGTFRQVDELKNRIRKLDGKDPFDYCTEVIANENEPTELRLQAANYQLPFLYAKRGAVPQPPDPAYWNVEVRIQKAVTVAQARENLQFISDLKLEGRISEQQSDSLFAEHGKILDALIDEAKLAAADPGAEQLIQITGGLPPLPGTDVIMPELNGYRRHRRSCCSSIPGP
jgi:hypothetical protein